MDIFLIDHQQWHLRYEILENQNFDVEKLLSMKNEEFTVVIYLPLQMHGLKGSRRAPAFNVLVLLT